MFFSSFSIRMYAFLLDYLMIITYGVIILGTASFVFRPYVQSLFSTSPVIAQVTGFCLMTLPVSLYFILCERSKWQATWGKRKMGICVVDKSGQRIGIGRSLVRTALKFLPWELAHFAIWQLMLPSSISYLTSYIILASVYLIVFGYILTPFTNKSRKNIYDFIAGTKVVHWNQ